MKYKVSQELIEILLKNGFREVTQKTYPEHYAKLLKNGYNPDSIKRHFVFKKNSHWVAYIKFDYTYIQILHDTPCLQEMLYAIDENQLKSVFTFFKMPAVVRRKFDNVGMTNLFMEYNEIKNNPEWRNSSADKKLIEIFDSITI